MNKEIYLIVDRQNAGRSQIGEGFLRHYTADNPNFDVISAGIDITGMKEKYDNHPNPKVISVMQEKSVDVSRQHITQVTPELLKQSTKIIVLTEEQELPSYFKEFKDKTMIIPIEDPAPGNTDVTDLQKLRTVRDQIEFSMFQISHKT